MCSRLLSQPLASFKSIAQATPSSCSKVGRKCFAGKYVYKMLPLANPFLDSIYTAHQLIKDLQKSYATSSSECEETGTVSLAFHLP